MTTIKLQLGINTIWVREAIFVNLKLLLILYLISLANNAIWYFASIQKQLEAAYGGFSLTGCRLSLFVLAVIVGILFYAVQSAKEEAPPAYLIVMGIVLFMAMALLVLPLWNEYVRSVDWTVMESNVSQGVAMESKAHYFGKMILFLPDLQQLEAMFLPILLYPLLLLSGKKKRCQQA